MKHVTIFLALLLPSISQAEFPRHCKTALIADQTKSQYLQKLATFKKLHAVRNNAQLLRAYKKLACDLMPISYDESGNKSKCGKEMEFDQYLKLRAQRMQMEEIEIVKAWNAIEVVYERPIECVEFERE